jgi:hypothetical protein
MHTSSPVAFKASEAAFVKSKITHAVLFVPLFFSKTQNPIAASSKPGRNRVADASLRSFTKSAWLDTRYPAIRWYVLVKRLTRATLRCPVLYRYALKAVEECPVNTT